MLLKLITLLLFVTNVLAGETYFYRVKKGDQLGAILYSLGFRNLWGDEGSVQDFAKNQKEPVHGQGAKILKGGDLIYPGTLITIHPPIALGCNVSIFGKEITILKNIRTQVERDQFACPDGSRDITSIPVKVFERHGRITIMPNIGFSNTKASDNSNGATSDVNSESNLGVNVKWEQVWSEKKSTYLGLDVQNLKIAPPANRTISGDDNKTLVKIGAGFRYAPNSKWLLDTGFKYGSEFFIFAPSNTQVRLDSANVLSAHLGVDYTFADLNPFVFGAKFGTHFQLGADVMDYKSRSTLGLSSGLFIKQKMKNNKYMLGDIIIRRQVKDTSLFNQDLTEVRFNFGLSWEIK